MAQGEDGHLSLEYLKVAERRGLLLLPVQQILFGLWSGFQSSRTSGTIIC